uniref:TF-B3 domain-containing protein n=1 Tax=Setaria viridis TaxID=4556 RepID=A0A4U6TMA5_SETVI|nr:hypothetical protein SEVIR_7G059400v2 [Setaria viridis]
MGSSSGDHGARTAIARHLKVLLPSSTSPHLRRARSALEGAGGAGGTALVVSPIGGKVWRVEVGRDADGRVPGPRFAAAHGFGAGWFLVLRHEAGSVLTVKAFDTTCCLREFGRPLTVAANQSGSGGSRRPQFINVLLPPSMEKMGIPPKFVHKYITEREAESSVAVLLSTLCKV